MPTAPPRSTPGQSITGRLAGRSHTRARVGPRASFFHRLGVQDPFALANVGDRADRPLAADTGPFTYLSSAAYYAEVADARYRMLARITAERASARIGERLERVGPAALDPRPLSPTLLGAPLEMTTLVDTPPVPERVEEAAPRRRTRATSRRTPVGRRAALPPAAETPPAIHAHPSGVQTAIARRAERAPATLREVPAPRRPMERAYGRTPRRPEMARTLARLLDAVRGVDRAAVERIVDLAESASDPQVVETARRALRALRPVARVASRSEPDVRSAVDRPAARAATRLADRESADASHVPAAIDARASGVPAALEARAVGVPAALDARASRMPAATGALRPVLSESPAVRAVRGERTAVDGRSLAPTWLERATHPVERLGQERRGVPTAAPVWLEEQPAAVATPEPRARRPATREARTSRATRFAAPVDARQRSRGLRALQTDGHADPIGARADAGRTASGEHAPLAGAATAWMRTGRPSIDARDPRVPPAIDPRPAIPPSMAEPVLAAPVEAEDRTAPPARRERATARALVRADRREASWSTIAPTPTAYVARTATGVEEPFAAVAPAPSRGSRTDRVRARPAPRTRRSTRFVPAGEPVAAERPLDLVGLARPVAEPPSATVRAAARADETVAPLLSASPVRRLQPIGETVLLGEDGPEVAQDLGSGRASERRTRAARSTATPARRSARTERARPERTRPAPIAEPAAARGSRPRPKPAARRAAERATVTPRADARGATFLRSAPVLPTRNAEITPVPSPLRERARRAVPALATFDVEVHADPIERASADPASPERTGALARAATRDRADVRRSERGETLLSPASSPVLLSPERAVEEIELPGAARARRAEAVTAAGVEERAPAGRPITDRTRRSSRPAPVERARPDETVLASPRSGAMERAARRAEANRPADDGRVSLATLPTAHLASPEVPEPIAEAHTATARAAARDALAVRVDPRGRALVAPIALAHLAEVASPAADPRAPSARVDVPSGRPTRAGSAPRRGSRRPIVVGAAPLEPQLATPSARPLARTAPDAVDRTLLPRVVRPFDLSVLLPELAAVSGADELRTPSGRAGGEPVEPLRVRRAGRRGAAAVVSRAPNLASAPDRVLATPFTVPTTGSEPVPLRGVRPVPSERRTGRTGDTARPATRRSARETTRAAVVAALRSERTPVSVGASRRALGIDTRTFVDPRSLSARSTDDPRSATLEARVVQGADGRVRRVTARRLDGSGGVVPMGLPGVQPAIGLAARAPVPSFASGSERPAEARADGVRDAASWAEGRATAAIRGGAPGARLAQRAVRPGVGPVSAPAGARPDARVLAREGIGPVERGSALGPISLASAPVPEAADSRGRAVGSAGARGLPGTLAYVASSSDPEAMAPGQPGWARRAVAPTGRVPADRDQVAREPRIRAGGGLLTALARAGDPEELVRVILERSGAGAGELGGEAGSLVQRIVRGARAEQAAQEQVAAMPQLRTITRHVFTPTQAGHTTPTTLGGSGARSSQGVGASGVMKLAGKLMKLIHLAESERRLADAQKQVRMAEDTGSTRSDAGAGQSGGESVDDKTMNIKALRADVLDSVLRELESMRWRREDPDGPSNWC